MRAGRHLRRGGSAVLTSTLLATLLVGVGIQQQATSPSTAERPDTAPASGSTYLCTGYAGCRNAGYSDAGYGAANNRMYWRMYSGHNCTNYVAYRMIRAGMSTERPWSGTGMAYNWGHAMSRRTDRTPSVGAVAWWDRYDNGIGSSGHVAYVERVVSSTEIIISEDSWGGNFHWRRITKDSGRWPTGFIHLVDKTIESAGAPTILGTPQVGVPLRATRGAWRPRKDLTVTFRWYADGAPVAGATGRTFTPGPAHKGTRVTVAVTAKRRGYNPTTVASVPTAAVARGQFTVVAPPTISGDPMVDKVLIATPATWSPAPESTVYRWLADGVVIDGETGRRLTLTRDLLGKRIRVTTGAQRTGYQNSPVRSAAVGPVVVGAIEVTKPYGVAGRARVGEELTVTPGAANPADSSVAYQWLRDGAPISGATAPSYAITAADVGAHLSLRVTLTRRNYTPRVETVAVDGVVTTPSTVRVRAMGKSRKAVVITRVTAPGVAAVPGRVTVKVGAREQTARLVDGRARLVFDRLAPGDRAVRVAYGGTSVVEPARASTTVRVLR